MLFTVIQYLPILEEEVPSHRLELAKKLKHDDGGSDGDTDEDTSDPDPDPDSKADINYYPVSNFVFGLSYTHNFPSKNKSWPKRAKSITTPPPQI